MSLFNIPPKEPESRKQKCQDCEYSQRWECNGKIFWYCSARKSNRTENKLLKIKARQEACDNFKEMKTYGIQMKAKNAFDEHGPSTKKVLQILSAINSRKMARQQSKKVIESDLIDHFNP